MTVTFLEMERPPASYSSLPYNRQVALLRTRDIPAHYYRYLLDRVGRKWHWVNALRMPPEEMVEGLHKPDRDIRPLVSMPVPPDFFGTSSHICRMRLNSPISA